MRKWIFRAGGMVALAGGLLIGLLAIGKVVHEDVRALDRYAVPFSSIQCPAPPYQRRSEFLSEVQYLGELPGQLHLLDDHLPRRLAEAFASHPWVEQVERVEVTPQRQVRIGLTFRTPVLAVVWQAAPDSGKLAEPQTRAVDRSGIVLPAQAEIAGLPVFRAGRAGPTQPAGHVWGSAAVSAAARTANVLRSAQKRLRIESIEQTESGLVLYTSVRARVLWGEPPGSERPGEALAAEKVRRLLDYCARNGDLGRPEGPYEHDVRPHDRAVRRSLESVTAP